MSIGHTSLTDCKGLLPISNRPFLYAPAYPVGMAIGHPQALPLGELSAQLPERGTKLAWEYIDPALLPCRFPGMAVPPNPKLE